MPELRLCKFWLYRDPGKFCMRETDTNGHCLQAISHVFSDNADPTRFLPPICWHRISIDFVKFLAIVCRHRHMWSNIIYDLSSNHCEKWDKSIDSDFSRGAKSTPRYSKRMTKPLQIKQNTLHMRNIYRTHYTFQLSDALTVVIVARSFK